MGGGGGKLWNLWDKKAITHEGFNNKTGQSLLQHRKYGHCMNHKSKKQKKKKKPKSDASAGQQQHPIRFQCNIGIKKHTLNWRMSLEHLEVCRVPVLVLGSLFGLCGVLCRYNLRGLGGDEYKIYDGSGVDGDYGI